MTVRYEPRIARLLSDIEVEMRSAGLWQQKPPPADALASSVPFAMDRLSFPEWLQWIFLPRMREVVDNGQPLPARCQIAPAAEVYFSDSNIPGGRLLDLLSELDAAVPAPPGQ